MLLDLLVSWVIWDSVLMAHHELHMVVGPQGRVDMYITSISSTHTYIPMSFGLHSQKATTKIKLLRSLR